MKSIQKLNKETKDYRYTLVKNDNGKTIVQKEYKNLYKFKKCKGYKTYAEARRKFNKKNRKTAPLIPIAREKMKYCIETSRDFIPPHDQMGKSYLEKVKKKQYALEKLAIKVERGEVDADHLQVLAYFPYPILNAIDKGVSTAAKQLHTKSHDLKQEAYTAIIAGIEKMDTTKSIGEIEHWCQKVAKNAMLDVVRRKTYEVSIGEDEDGNHLRREDLMESPQPQPIEDWKKIWKKILKTLNTSEKAVIKAIYRDNETMVEVANNLSLSYKQIRTIKGRAELAIQGAIDKSGYDEFRKFVNSRDLWWNQRTGWMTYEETTRTATKYQHRDYTDQYLDIDAALYAGISNEDLANLSVKKSK